MPCQETVHLPSLGNPGAPPRGAHLRFIPVRFFVEEEPAAGLYADAIGRVPHRRRRLINLDVAEAAAEPDAEQTADYPEDESGEMTK